MPDSKKLNEKVAVVTGASSGLGRQFALTLAEAGATVALASRRSSNLERLAAEIEASNGRAMPITMDVTDAESVRSGIKAIEGKLGPIAILVNNAGLSVEHFITDFPIEDFDKLMNTNVRGAWLVAQEVGRSMISHGAGGKIINIASILATSVMATLSVYSMSKAAIMQMTRSMALEWARYNIQVNAIAPGYIETEINTDHFQSEIGQAHISRLLRKRVGAPKDLDGALMLLATSNSDFVTGSVITLDDGQSLKGV
ncbi:MAG TPA: SDR family NAD(P)-dependent oxidoreductase [Sneathiellales bacterium]|nr:SDR family NAD(P)-dependent oxidoreductase [Sneathiellales bacterium]